MTSLKLLCHDFRMIYTEATLVREYTAGKLTLSILHTEHLYLFIYLSEFSATIVYQAQIAWASTVLYPSHVSISICVYYLVVGPKIPVIFKTVDSNSNVHSFNVHSP